MEKIHSELETLISKKLPHMNDNSTYTDIEIIQIENSSGYSQMAKALKKFNTSAKAAKKLRELRESYEKARELFNEKKYLFIAVDVESYERDHACILEVGWSIYDSRKDITDDPENKPYLDRHFCATEYRHMKNGKYVPDMKDKYMFGETIWANLNSIADQLRGDLNEAEKGTVVFVGHDTKTDVKYLESIGIFVERDIEPAGTFDTAEMYAARSGKANDRINLGRSCDEMGIENYCLHNAGNDAHYTLLLFIELCRQTLPDIDLSNINTTPTTSKVTYEVI
ncbi:7067_t:CDS:2 [Paraglomus brasilianum]|uniref:7067_t:CDS:1 n=1 Tax=Paraglomus brasilianum TaxID=144538 RepID=A0A9N8VLD8_9GLOM|nr:7067_t:CDS:2 [Paraglomus brasilianum]